jgi:hypothetical protein
MKGCLAPAIARFIVCAPQKEVHDLSVSMLSGHMQRCGEALIDYLRMRARKEERFDDLAIAVPGPVVKGGKPPITDGVDVRPGANEHGSDLRLAELSGRMQSS